MGLTNWGFKKSLWVFHLNAGACNNCDIEVLDCLCPKFDVERFGIKLVGSVKAADVLLVSGSVPRKVVPQLIETYEQAPKPVAVIALGSCGCTGGIFKDGYNFAGPVDKHIPVNAYVPGCPPRPEAIIDGIVKLLGKL